MLVLYWWECCTDSAGVHINLLMQLMGWCPALQAWDLQMEVCCGDAVVNLECCGAIVVLLFILVLCM